MATNVIGAFLFILAVILILLALFRVVMRGDDIRPSVLGVDEERVCSLPFIVRS